MTALIVTIVSVAFVVTAACVVPRRRAARKHREAADEAAAKDLYDHYLGGVDALTELYLLRAVSDEEWLAGIKAKAGKPGTPPRARAGPSRSAEPRATEDYPGATPDRLKDRQSRQRGDMSGLGRTIITVAALTGLGMAAAYVLTRLSDSWLMVAASLSLGSLAPRMVHRRMVYRRAKDLGSLAARMVYRRQKKEPEAFGVHEPVRKWLP